MDHSPQQIIANLCQEAGIGTIILLNPFSYMGIRRLENVVQELRNTLPQNCQIYLGGAEETVCASVLGPATGEGILVADTLESPSIAQSTGRALYIPIAHNTVAPLEERRLLASLLSVWQCEDAIEILLPGQTRDRTSSSWDPDWTIVVAPGTTDHDLRTTIDERIQRLGCANVTLTGDLFGPELWPEKSVLISWLDALKRDCATISVAIQDGPQVLEESLLQELHGLGLNKFCLRLSPSDLVPEKTGILSDMIAACREAHVACTMRGSLVTKEASWQKVRELWMLCDRIGLDLVEMLGATRNVGNDGWCGALCGVLSQQPSLFFEYRCARRHLELTKAHPEMYGKPHPSLLAFYREKCEHTRNRVLGELSHRCVLKRDLTTVQQVSREVKSELTGISSGLLRLSGKRTHEPHIAASTASQGHCSDTAIIVVAQNNPYNVRLCLHSIFLYTDHCYDLFVVDCGNVQSSCAAAPSPGRFTYDRLPRQGLKSFVTAWAIDRVWGNNQYRYVLLLDSNACALEADWLSEMIAELEQSSDIGVVGIRCDELNYKRDEGAAYLLRYVLSPGWMQGMGLRPPQTPEDLVQQLSATGTSCLAELTGWVQLYRGDVLRRIGLPIVDDTRLKHNHWDSELPMRAVACGYKTSGSSTARNKLHYFGKYYDSGIAGVSSYADDINGVRKWLGDNGHTALAELLRENTGECKGVQPSYYDWCCDASRSVVDNSAELPS
jgi:hypothetical protein